MIAEFRESNTIGSLLVFSDDWGRHPSSCQHLIRNLLDQYPVLWVNTIGTRAPKLDLQTVRRVTEKVKQWGSSKLSKATAAQALTTSAHSSTSHPHLTVVNPKMWPWFASDRDRRFNRWLLSKQLAPLIRELPQPVVAITTLPITADLPDSLPVDRWVYYCVDDFSQWPGLDGETLRRMDRDMIRRADSVVAVSETLQAMIANESRSSALLTHGVDVDFWQRPRQRPADSEDVRLRWAANPTAVCEQSPKLFKSPQIVFWGVIDRRMDSPSLIQLSRDLLEGTIVLIGPQQDPDPAILSLPNVQTLPAQPLSELPMIAEQADVLIMPYADLPVTRAMQPLKLKEYLATGKPVVVNRLPSTDAWSDCLDVAETPEQFSRLVRNRMNGVLPAPQAVARCRLQQESWKSKAEKLERLLSNPTGRNPHLSLHRHGTELKSVCALNSRRERQ
jgi:glycosyltransferase involved in cell wall biosynthesis